MPSSPIGMLDSYARVNASTQAESFRSNTAGTNDPSLFPTCRRFLLRPSSFGRPAVQSGSSVLNLWSLLLTHWDLTIEDQILTGLLSQRALPDVQPKLFISRKIYKPVLLCDTLSNTRFQCLWLADGLTCNWLERCSDASLCRIWHRHTSLVETKCLAYAVARYTPRPRCCWLNQYLQSRGAHSFSLQTNACYWRLVSEFFKYLNLAFANHLE